jgi:hypothetical protein
MDALAKYMGLTEAVNHTGKMAYFTKHKGLFKFVCHVNDFDPRNNKAVFITLMDSIVQQGAEITIHHKSLKNSAYVRYEAVMEINHQIYRAMGQSCQPAIVGVITRYVDNMKYENKIEDT